MLYCTAILDIADSREHKHKIPGDWDFYVAEKGGFCLASHLARSVRDGHRLAVSPAGETSLRRSNPHGHHAGGVLIPSHKNTDPIDVFMWRRRGDSNPRNLAVYSLSKRAH